MNELFNDLLAYNYDTNERLIKEFHQIYRPDPKIVKLLSHILNAHQIWNSRILTQPVQFEIFEIHDNEKLLEINSSNHSYSNQILADFELSDIISYENTKGNSFTNTIQDNVIHLINHSNYHRAQIAMKMRETGLEPLVTDYIFYKR